MDFMSYYNLFVIIINDILKTLKSYCVHLEKSIPADRFPFLFVTCKRLDNGKRH